MNIRLLLESKHTKSSIQSIVVYVDKNPNKFSELMESFFDDNIRICQRASCPSVKIVDKFPHLIVPYLPDMIKNIENPKHNATVRNTLRFWQNLVIPEEFQGEIYEKCFNYLIDPKVAIALRVFSMSVCANIASNIPDLKAELTIAISDQLEMASSGIRSCSLKILKALKR